MCVLGLEVTVVLVGLGEEKRGRRQRVDIFEGEVLFCVFLVFRISEFFSGEVVGSWFWKDYCLVQEGEVCGIFEEEGLEVEVLVRLVGEFWDKFCVILGFVIGFGYLEVFVQGRVLQRLSGSNGQRFWKEVVVGQSSWSWSLLGLSFILQEVVYWFGGFVGQWMLVMLKVYSGK